MFWGTWAVAVADVQKAFGLSDAMIGTLLSVAVLAGAAGNVLAGWVAHHWGTRRTLARAIALWAVIMAGTVGIPERRDLVVPFAAAVTALVACGGCIDALMNAAAATGLAGKPGKLVRFHSFFNVGALLGAATTGAAVRFGAGWRWSWALVGVVAGVTAWAVLAEKRPSRSAHEEELPEPAPEDRPVSPWMVIAQLRRDRLIVLAVLLGVATLVEGGVDTWGVLFLRTSLSAGVLLGAGAYGIGQALAASTRGGGGPLIGRIGTRRGVALGAAIAAGGLGLEAGTSQPVLAALGLALAGAGISTTWPLLVAEGASRSSRPALGVTGMTTFGYLGIVAGPVVIGWIAGTAGLRAGIAVLAALAVSVAAIRVTTGTGPAGASGVAVPAGGSVGSEVPPSP